MTFYSGPTVNAFSTSLDGALSEAETTISLSSVVGLQAPGVLVIDRQDGVGNNTDSKREYISFTGISGGDITGVSRGLGGSSDQAHSSGALVESVFDVTMWNALIDNIADEDDMSSDSASKLATQQSIKAYVDTVAATKADDADLTTHESDTTAHGATGANVGTTNEQTLTNKTLTSPVISGSGGTSDGQQGYDTTNKALYIGDGSAKQSIMTSAWKSYTPDLTNITIGNGTLAFVYCQIGKTVHVRGKFTMGSTSSIGGLMTFSLPVTAKASSNSVWVCNIYDNGTAWIPGIVQQPDTTTVQIKAINTSATYATLTDTSSSVPMTWATSDFVAFELTYEAA